ncbi:Gfo/Idh/MocA family oxidoreductase [Virgibacillus siamensis]|uniref:Gfo/Idh/MocA family oxidoreductase n=1 Tax=Virgibacillus siamensis TaxID=480071 RepID=A0ABP3QLS8_9BACI
MKAGIIGCGSIAKFRHAPEYSENPYVDEIVFYDRNMERSRGLAELFGGSMVENVEELFENPGIEVISDCSSNENHHVFSTRALLSGKHVLCEKPISLTVTDAEKILDAQKKSGKKLMVGHNQRFNRAHQKAREIIVSGELGRLLTFKLSFGHKGPEHWGVNKTKSTWFFKKDRSNLGVAGDLGIHKIDLLQYLLDDQVALVSSFQGTLDKVDELGKPIEVCDNIVSNLKMSNGQLGTASFSWTYYGEEDNSTILYFEKGIMKVYDDPDYQIKINNHGGEQVKYELGAMQTNDNQTSTGVIDSFIESIRLDKDPVVTGEDAVASLKVVLAMLKSAENGAVVEV